MDHINPSSAPQLASFDGGGRRDLHVDPHPAVPARGRPPVANAAGRGKGVMENPCIKSMHRSSLSASWASDLADSGEAIALPELVRHSPPPAGLVVPQNGARPRRANPSPPRGGSNDDFFYLSTPTDGANTMTQHQQHYLRSSYAVRLGPLRVLIRPGYVLDSDDYRFPLQCYRYRHADGSLITLMAEECTAVGPPMTVDEYVSRSLEATSAAAQRSKMYFKVELNTPAKNVVTTVMQRYLLLNIGLMPVVIASFFIVTGSLALTIQLQTDVTVFKERKADLIATVQNVKFDELCSRQFAMIARGGLSTHQLSGPACQLLLKAPTTFDVTTVAITPENQSRHTDLAGNVTVAQLVYRASPRWEARVIVQVQSRWRVVRWLRQAQAGRGAGALTGSPHELPLMPGLASLLLEGAADAVLASARVTVDILHSSGALCLKAPPSSSPGRPTQRQIEWVTPGDDRSSSPGDVEWATAESFYPRYESAFWTLPLPSTALFHTKICEHAGDTAATLLICASEAERGEGEGEGAPETFELEPMLLRCACRERAASCGPSDTATDPCVRHFIRGSEALLTAAEHPALLVNALRESCVIVDGVSRMRPDCALRLAAVHVRQGEDRDGYWVVFRWTFPESHQLSGELRRYEQQLLQNGRPR